MPPHIAAHSFGEPGLDRLRPSSAKHLAELHFGVIAATTLLTLLLLALMETKASDFDGPMWLPGTLFVSSCLARWEVRRDHLARAMDLHAIATAVAVAALAIGSPSPVIALVTLMSHLPMYALIRGLRRSALLWGPLVLLALGTASARLLGWPLPIWFPGAPVAQLMVALAALVAALLPWGLLQRDLRLAQTAIRRELAERRRAQAELAMSLQRLEDFATCASDWFWETDAEHRFVRHSLANKDKGDWQADTFIGHRRWELTPPKDEAGQIFWARHRAVLDTHRPFRNMEYETEVSGKGLCWISVSGVPVFNQKGEFTGYRGSSSDITERKRQEQELQQALEAAESGNRAKADFLSTISHEVRAPLNGILGMAHLMQNTPLNDEQREYLQLLHQSSDMLLAIIDDVLDISRLEKGEVKLEPVSFDPCATLRWVAEVLRPDAERALLSLRVDIAHDVPTQALGDERRFRQVLLHLGHNAVKFTSKGSIGLALQVRSRSGGSIEVQGTVSDTGIGISAEHMAKLFEPFSQVDGSITRRHSGTGVGLAISRRLARLMGGDVWAESEPGRGSHFHFTAQLALSTRAVEPQPVKVVPTMGPTKPKLLVVDDVEVNLIVLSKLLEIEGFEVLQATGGEQAVALWRQGRPDLILMDLQMPGVDGLEATRQIRAQEAQEGTQATKQQVTIVALTGGGAGYSREKCMAAGMNGYVTKPVKRPDLVRVVQAHLRACAEG